MLVGVRKQLVPRQQVPFAPRSDHFDIRHQRIGAEFETHLVVALAGGTVRDCVGAGLACDLDQVLGDQRASDRGAEQVFTLVNGIGAEHREDKIANEFFAQVFDEDLPDAELPGFPACRLQFLTLPDVGSEGDDFAAVGVLQPLQDHRRVQPAGVGEHHFS